MGIHVLILAARCFTAQVGPYLPCFGLAHCCNLFVGAYYSGRTPLEFSKLLSREIYEILHAFHWSEVFVSRCEFRKIIARQVDKWQPITIAFRAQRDCRVVMFDKLQFVLYRDNIRITSALCEHASDFGCSVRSKYETYRTLHKTVTIQEIKALFIFFYFNRQSKQGLECLVEEDAALRQSSYRLFAWHNCLPLASAVIFFKKATTNERKSRTFFLAPPKSCDFTSF